MYLSYFGQVLGSKKTVAGILAHVWMLGLFNAALCRSGLVRRLAVSSQHSRQNPSEIEIQIITVPIEMFSFEPYCRIKK